MNLINVLSTTASNQKINIEKETAIRSFAAFSIDRVKNLPLSRSSKASLVHHARKPFVLSHISPLFKNQTLCPHWLALKSAKCEEEILQNQHSVLKESKSMPDSATSLPLFSLFPMAEAVPVPKINNPQVAKHTKEYAQWQQEGGAENKQLINSGNTSVSLHRIKRAPGPTSLLRSQVFLMTRNKIAKTRQEKLAFIQQVANNKGPRNMDDILAAGDALKDLLSMGPMEMELQSVFTNYDLPDHSRDLLKYHLPSERVMDAFHHTAIFKHCDPRELLQIVEFFSPQMQLGEMLLEIEKQIILLILDKNMTDDQKIQFRKNYLESFRNRVLRMPETELLAMGIKKTVSDNALHASGYSFGLVADGVKALTSGPFGVIILTQQLHDLNQGYDVSSFSVEQIHWLELGATLFSYAIGFVPLVGEAVMVMTGTVDFIEALAASKTDICAYIKNGISIGMGAKGFAHRINHGELANDKPLSNSKSQTPNFLTTTQMDRAELKREFDMPTDDSFPATKIQAAGAKRSVELEGERWNLIAEPHSHHWYRLQRDSSLQSGNEQFKPDLYIEKPAGSLRKVQALSFDLSDTLGHLHQLDNLVLKEKLQNVLNTSQGYLLKKRMQHPDLSELSADLKQGVDITTTEVLALKYQTSKGMCYAFGLKVEVDGHALILDINAQAHSPQLASSVVLMEPAEWKHCIIDASPEKAVEESTQSLAEYSKLFASHDSQANLASDSKAPTSWRAFSHTEAELARRQQLRDQKYQEYQKTANYPNVNFIDLLNKDHTENADQWIATNAVTSSLHLAMLAKKLSLAAYNKACALLTQSGRFRAYFTLLNIEQRPAFAFDKPLSQTGFLSFTAKSDPTQVTHTLYIQAPESIASESIASESTATPTLFTEGRLDLAAKLDGVSQGKAAATTLGYPLTESMQAGLKQWCEANDYEARFTAVGEVARKVTEHAEPEFASVDFMNEYNVAVTDSVLLIKEKGVKPLPDIPSSLMTAENIVRYLQAQHHNELLAANKVDLGVSNSGRGGEWNSLAQSVANGLGLPVIGHEERSTQEQIYYPQMGDQKALTQTASEILGDKGRSALLRKAIEWGSIRMDDLKSRIDEDPQAFLNDNALTVKEVDTKQDILLSEIAKNKYEISNTAHPKRAKITPDVLEVTSEQQVDLTRFKGVALSSMVSNFLAITQSPELSFAIKTIGDETYVAHLEPAVDSGDPMRGENLQSELDENGWHTLGPKEYQGSTARIYGWKQNGHWRFYEQKQLQSAYYQAREIFTDTPTKRIEDLTANQELKEKLRECKQALASLGVKDLSEDLNLEAAAEQTIFGNIEGITDSERALMKSALRSYPELLAKIESSKPLSAQDCENITRESSTDYAYPLVENEGKKYALVYMANGVELLFEVQVNGDKKNLLLVEGIASQAENYEITEDGQQVKRKETLSSIALSLSEIEAKLVTSLRSKVQLEHLLHETYSQAEQYQALKASLAEHLLELEKLTQEQEVAERIQDYVRALRATSQGLTKRLSDIETFRQQAFEKVTDISNLVQVLKSELASIERAEVTETKIKAAHNQLSTLWVSYKKAVSALHLSTGQDQAALQKVKENQWREYSKALAALETLKDQDLWLRKALATQEVKGIEASFDEKAKKEVEKYKRCKRANESCTANNQDTQAAPTETARKPVKAEFWDELASQLPEAAFKRKFVEFLQTDLSIDSSAEQHALQMTVDTPPRYMMLQKALFMKALQYKSKFILGNVSKIIKLSDEYVEQLPSAGQRRTVRNERRHAEIAIPRVFSEVFRKYYLTYQEALRKDFRTMRHSELQSLIRGSIQSITQLDKLNAELNRDVTYLEGNKNEVHRIFNEAMGEAFFETVNMDEAARAHRDELVKIVQATLLEQNIESFKAADFDAIPKKYPAKYYHLKALMLGNQALILKLYALSNFISFMKEEAQVAAFPDKTERDFVDKKTAVNRSMNTYANKFAEYKSFADIAGTPRENIVAPGADATAFPRGRSGFLEAMKNVESTKARFDTKLAESGLEREVFWRRVKEYVDTEGPNILRQTLSNPKYRQLTLSKDSLLNSVRAKETDVVKSASEIGKKSSGAEVSKEPPYLFELNQEGRVKLADIVKRIDGSEETPLVSLEHLESVSTYPTKYYTAKLAAAEREFTRALLNFKRTIVDLVIARKEGRQDAVREIGSTLAKKFENSVGFAIKRSNLANVFAAKKENQMPKGQKLDYSEKSVEEIQDQLLALDQEIQTSDSEYKNLLETSSVTQEQINSHIRSFLKSRVANEILSNSLTAYKRKVKSVKSKVLLQDLASDTRSAQVANPVDVSPDGVNLDGASDVVSSDASLTDKVREEAQAQGLRQEAERKKAEEKEQAAAQERGREEVKRVRAMLEAHLQKRLKAQQEILRADNRPSEVGTAGKLVNGKLVNVEQDPVPNPSSSNQHAKKRKQETVSEARQPKQPRQEDIANSLDPKLKDLLESLGIPIEGNIDAAIENYVQNLNDDGALDSELGLNFSNLAEAVDEVDADTPEETFDQKGTFDKDFLQRLLADDDNLDDLNDLNWEDVTGARGGSDTQQSSSRFRRSLGGTKRIEASKAFKLRSQINFTS